ncbi:PIF1-like helicase-domain-containing protein [Desarmillaria ectypa]|nr:PIF1-like helicase-domain-containing protein [Desarmillaria ectypa]
MSTTTTAKRKTKSIPSTSKRPAKKPRHTLDSFFSQVAVCSDDPDGQATTKHVSLSAEQIRVLRMVVNEEQNVFFTGAAGTGKSLLLRAIINALREKYAKDPDAVAVTASTGMAASNIGGQTLHAWGAVAPTVDDLDNLIKCIRTCRPALQRWKKAKVLIIDESASVFSNIVCKFTAGSLYGGWISIQSALRDCQKTEEKNDQAIWWFTTGRHW